MSDAQPHVRIHPPLHPREVDFLAAFVSEAGLRRVWPGQPSSSSPWCPSDDGLRLELDQRHADAEPQQVAPWLQFISREFLAPASAAALAAALDAGLRGGHRLSGGVVVGDELRVSVELNRVVEELLPPQPASRRDAVVLDLVARRSQTTER